MLYGVHEIRIWNASVKLADGNYHPARPLWITWGRWRHAWWVLTGRCDAVWWPEDGNPYWEKSGPQGRYRAAETQKAEHE